MREQIAVFGAVVVTTLFLTFLVMPELYGFKGGIPLSESGLPAVAGLSEAALQVDRAATGAVRLEPGSNPAEVSPDMALANGKPTLFYMMPAEICQTRDCRPAADIAARLHAHYQERVNFVPVQVYAVPPGVSMEPYGHLSYANLNLFSTVPFSDWLPAPAMTPFGIGLEEPMVLLVDSEANLLYRGSESFAILELGPYLQDSSSE